MEIISEGAGIPLHFLAEPESATRSTADAAGGPTFRRMEQRQEFFLWMMEDITRVVLNRRAMVDKKLKGEMDIQITGADINTHDNTKLSQSAFYMIGVLGALRDRSLITNNLLRTCHAYDSSGSSTRHPVFCSDLKNRLFPLS